MLLSRKLLISVSVPFIIAAIVVIISSCTHSDTRNGERTPTAVRASNKPLILIGNIPGQYLSKAKSKFFLGYVEVGVDQRITGLGALTAGEVSAFVEKEKSSKTVVVLKSPNAKGFDAIYPGLLNLHNHTKQNVLPTWPAAKGQFQNRFEWRDWGNYKKSVSQNMNPWISYGGAMNCAAFRWSNLQNMINGTTYLQGPSSCISGFGIYKVEDSTAYVSEKAAVQAPTDLVYPLEMAYVWNVLKKDIDGGMTYEKALLKDIKLHCAGDEINKVTVDNINTAVGVKILSNKKILESSCTKETATLHPKFIRYIYFIHKTIAGKKEYIKSANRSAIIAHLAEGRRNDPYNQTEYQMIKLLGLNQPHVNFIHGVGLRTQDFADLAKNKMGLIWSPYSNLLLYGETLDIEAANKAGVVLSIGSDWVPTGTKSVLEEIKVAASYVDRTSTSDKSRKLNKIFTDEYLYKMMTENAAKLINHWEITNAEAGVGQLAVGAMASIISTSILSPNPYTNIVRKVTEREINLVVVNGNPIYGNINYLEEAGITNEQYEIFSNEISVQNASAVEKIYNAGILKPDLEKMKASDTEAGGTEEDGSGGSTQSSAFFNKLAIDIRNYGSKISRKDVCQFKIAKAFVNPNTKTKEVIIGKFAQDTGLDLDKVSDIQLLLGVSSLTQSLNRLSSQGDPNFAMGYFPNLYTCSDEADKNSHRHLKYVTSSGNDELNKNMAAATRAENRKTVPKTAETLAAQYGLKFEVK